MVLQLVDNVPVQSCVRSKLRLLLCVHMTLVLALVGSICIHFWPSASLNVSTPTGFIGISFFISVRLLFQQLQDLVDTLTQTLTRGQRLHCHAKGGA